jgi:membrane associated rhomboid family serine protease
MSIIDDLKLRYQQGSIVQKLIYINVGIFVITLLISVFSGLYRSEGNFLTNWFSLDSELDVWFTKPWSILTYGFLHGGFLHLLFNMIALHYIGNLFIDYFTQKQLLTFYLLGTFFGGLLYMLSYNYFPLFEGSNSILVGSSAGVSAIFMGIAAYIPNFEFKLPLIGFVKLWIFAAIWVAFDVLGLVGANAGGHFAHLGGSLFGFLYVSNVSNKELNLLDGFFNLFKSKKKPLRTVYKAPKKSEKNDNQQKIDSILDKISKSGYDSLTKAEKEFLFKQGKS